MGGLVLVFVSLVQEGGFFKLNGGLVIQQHITTNYK
jgi:hypothetical protein